MCENRIKVLPKHLSTSRHLCNLHFLDGAPGLVMNMRQLSSLSVCAANMHQSNVCRINTQLAHSVSWSGSQTSHSARVTRQNMIYRTVYPSGRWNMLVRHAKRMFQIIYKYTQAALAQTQCKCLTHSELQLNDSYCRFSIDGRWLWGVA